MDVCKNCEHCANVQDGPRTQVWYNWYCHHPDIERVPAQDCVNGRAGWVAKNDLGRGYVSDQKHPHCRDINSEGECEFYQEKVGNLVDWDAELRKLLDGD